MNRFNSWRRGLKDGLPICFGYFAVAFTFGIKATGTGLQPFQSTLLSATNLTSAGQFAGLDLIAYGASFGEMAVTQLIINLRYCLMSCSLSQKLEAGINPIHRFFMSYGVTDEIFGISICREEALSPYYFYGAMSAAVPGWTFGTLLGAVSGNIMPPALLSALGIAIYGMFLAVILPPAKKSRAILAVAASAMVLSTAFSALPPLREISGGFRIILITVTVSGAAAVLRPIEECDEDGE